MKKKIKTVEQELATIASIVKDLSISFPLIGQKEKERKQLLLQLQSMEGSQKEATQMIPMHVHMPYQPRQSLYKDLSMPLTSPFSPTSPYQNLQPLAMIHPNHNPFKPSEILLSITYSVPPQLEPQAGPQNESSPIKKDKKLVFIIFLHLLSLSISSFHNLLTPSIPLYLLVGIKALRFVSPSFD